MLLTDPQSYVNRQRLWLGNLSTPAQMQRAFEFTNGRSLWQIGFIPTPAFNPMPDQSMSWFDKNQDICRHGIVQSIQHTATHPVCTLRLVPHLSILKNHHRPTNHFYLPPPGLAQQAYCQQLATELCQQAGYPLSHIHWHIDKTPQKPVIGVFWQRQMQHKHDFFMQLIAYQDWYFVLTHHTPKAIHPTTKNHIEHIHFYSHQRTDFKKNIFIPTNIPLRIDTQPAGKDVTLVSCRTVKKTKNHTQQLLRINHRGLSFSPGEKIYLNDISTKHPFWVFSSTRHSCHSTYDHTTLINRLPLPDTYRTLTTFPGITGTIRKNISPGLYHVEIDHASASQSGNHALPILSNVPHSQHQQNTKNGWHWPLPANQKVYLQFCHADPLKPIITSCINNSCTDNSSDTWRCTLGKHLGIISSYSSSTFLSILHREKTRVLFHEKKHEWHSEGGRINQYTQTRITQSPTQHVSSTTHRHTGDRLRINTTISYQQCKHLNINTQRQQNHHHTWEWFSKKRLKFIVKTWRSQLQKLNFNHQSIALSTHHWHHQATQSITLQNGECQIQITPQNILLMANRLQANNVNFSGNIQGTPIPSPPPTIPPIAPMYINHHPRWLARLAFGHIKRLFWSNNQLIWGHSLNACIDFQAPPPNLHIKLHVFLKNTTHIEPNINPRIDTISHHISQWQDLQSITWSSTRCQKTLPCGRDIYFQIESQIGLSAQYSDLCHCLQPCQFTVFFSPFSHHTSIPSNLSITLSSQHAPDIRVHTPPTPSHTIYSNDTGNLISITQEEEGDTRHITLLSAKKTHPHHRKKISIPLSPKPNTKIYALPPPMLFNLRHPELNPPFLLNNDKAYLKTQKKVCLFIHGFNIDEGDWGCEINNITVTHQAGENLAAADLSNINCTYLRRWKTLCQRYPCLKQPLHEIDASIDPKKKLNGTADINWFLHMEDNLHRAREPDYDCFNRYERLIHVRWAGNPSFILNYQSAVNKTIPTGEHLAHLIADLSQLNITIDIIAHSLGCGVACQALNLCGKKNKKAWVRHVFLCNAAVPNNLFTKNANNISPTWYLPNLPQAAEHYHLIYSKHDHILGPIDQQENMWDKKHWQHRELWEEYLSALLLHKLHLGSVYLLANHLGVTVHELFNPSDQHIIYQLWRKSNPQDHLPEHFSTYKRKVLHLHTDWLAEIKEKFIAFHHDAHKRQVFFHSPPLPHSRLANRLHTWLKQNNPLSSFWSGMAGVCALFLLIKAGDTLKTQPAMGFSGPDTTDPQTAQLLMHHKIQAWCLDNHIHSHSAIKKPSPSLMRALYQKIVTYIDQPS